MIVRWLNFAPLVFVPAVPQYVLPRTLPNMLCIVGLLARTHTLPSTLFQFFGLIGKIRPTVNLVCLAPLIILHLPCSLRAEDLLAHRLGWILYLNIVLGLLGDLVDQFVNKASFHGNYTILSFVCQGFLPCKYILPQTDRNNRKGVPAWERLFIILLSFRISFVIHRQLIVKILTRTRVASTSKRSFATK